MIEAVYDEFFRDLPPRWSTKTTPGAVALAGGTDPKLLNYMLYFENYGKESVGYVRFMDGVVIVRVGASKWVFQLADPDCFIKFRETLVELGKELYEKEYL